MMGNTRIQTILEFLVLLSTAATSKGPAKQGNSLDPKWACSPCYSYSNMSLLTKLNGMGADPR